MSFVQLARSPKRGPGTFLAVAAYDGLSAPFVSSLFESQARIDARLDLEIFAGNCHVDDSRNRLVRDFLETDCEQLIFLDADVFWRDADMRRLIEHKADIVAGIYPLKSADEDYPVAPLPGDRWANAEGLVEVAGVPTGFLKIRRAVLERLYEPAQKHRSKEDGHGRLLIPVLFERSLNGLSRRGGDYEFCRKAREVGFKIYVDPMMQLGHQGVKMFTGSLGAFWRKDVAIPEGLQAIAQGNAGVETFLEMYHAWDNLWAATPELLFTATLLARHAQGPILDCGSGLSSLCVAAATKQNVIALEQSPSWASRIESLARQNGLKNLTVHLSDLRPSGAVQWYADVPRDRYALAICDGPAGDQNRVGLFTDLEDDIAGARILVDDIQRRHSRQMADEYCASHGRQLEIIGASRPFGLIF